MVLAGAHINAGNGDDVVRENNAGNGDDVVGDDNARMGDNVWAVAMSVAVAMWVGVKHLHLLINAGCQSGQMLHPYGIHRPMMMDRGMRHGIRRATMMDWAPGVAFIGP